MPLIPFKGRPFLLKMGRCKDGVFPWKKLHQLRVAHRNTSAHAFSMLLCFGKFSARRFLVLVDAQQFQSLRDRDQGMNTALTISPDMAACTPS